MSFAALAASTLIFSAAVHTQQVPDMEFTPLIENAEYPEGQGPKVVIDSAHLNFHTADGGYAPFAKLLRLDGYRVGSNSAAFSADTLAETDILVIANAMHKQSEAGWAPLPNLSAFTDEEISAVEGWVRNGGSLLLIADHMPLAGHAENLAAAFGVRFQNGFAFDSNWNGNLTFRRSDGSLVDNVIANGRDAGERVDLVTTFGGQAFRLDPGINAEELLILPEGHTLVLPEVAFQFSEKTPRIPAANLLQGAIVYHGKGRAAFLGEAAMFTAQLAGSNKMPMGMNHPQAAENYRFALNLMHWLSGAVEK